MTDTDIKEFTDVERVIIAAVKIALAKKDIWSIINALMTDTSFHAKVVEAVKGCQDIGAELRTMTVEKSLEIIKVAIAEISAPTAA